MRSFKLLTTTALGSVVFFGAIAGTPAASAQTTAPVATQDQQPAAGTSTPANEDETDLEEGRDAGHQDDRQDQTGEGAEEGRRGRGRTVARGRAGDPTPRPDPAAPAGA